MSTRSPNPTYDTGDIAWVLASTALVWLMIPGVGFFYSGIARSKNALSMIMLSFLSIAIVSIQWFIWGFSLTYSKTSTNIFVGDLTNAFFRGVNVEPANGHPKVPDIVFAIFQSMFAAFTPALAIGSGAERGRLLPLIVFMFVWATIVYDPIAYWCWNPSGWANRLGSLDFAGGTPVHISSGAASLAYVLILPKRRGLPEAAIAAPNTAVTEEFKPHNVVNVLLGTALLWFGWFGFNGGSAIGGNMRAAMACVVTNLAASFGALTYMMIDYYWDEPKFSATSFCSGAVAGLVAITPGSGYVGPPAAVAFGVAGGAFCNIAQRFKKVFNYDDALDVFAIHAVGGLVGDILTGIFAESYIVTLDGSPPILGGWIDGNWLQVAYQLASGTAGMAYSFGVTYIILWLMNKANLTLGVEEDVEVMGIDIAEIGQKAYYNLESTGTQEP